MIYDNIPVSKFILWEDKMLSQIESQRTLLAHIQEKEKLTYGEICDFVNQEGLFFGDGMTPRWILEAFEITGTVRFNCKEDVYEACQVVAV